MPEDCLLGPPELNSGPSQALVSLSIRDQQEIGKRDCRWDQKGGAGRPGLVDITFFFQTKIGIIYQEPMNKYIEVWTTGE